MNPWLELGIPPGSDTRAIKLAYAARLKQLHPEEDVAGFQRLRQAYEAALLQSEEPAAADSQRRLQASSFQASSTRAIHSTAPILETQQPPPEFAAHQLFAQLLNAPEVLRPALLARSLRAPGWENLNFQAALEQAVIRGLAADFERLLPLIGVFDEYYVWPEFLDDMRKEDIALQSLLERYEVRRRRLGPAKPYHPAERARERALELLLQPVDEKAFRKFARGWENLKAMRSLLRQSRTSAAIVPGHDLNAASVNWWTQALPRMRSVERRFLLFVCGLLLSLPTLVELDWFTQGSRFDLDAHPKLAQPLFIIGICLPFVVDSVLLHLRVYELLMRIGAYLRGKFPAR